MPLALPPSSSTASPSPLLEVAHAGPDSCYTADNNSGITSEVDKGHLDSSYVGLVVVSTGEENGLSDTCRHETVDAAAGWGGSAEGAGEDAFRGPVGVECGIGEQNGRDPGLGEGGGLGPGDVVDGMEDGDFGGADEQWGHQQGDEAAAGVRGVEMGSVSVAAPPGAGSLVAAAVPMTAGPPPMQGYYGTDQQQHDDAAVGENVVGPPTTTGPPPMQGYYGATRQEHMQEQPLHQKEKEEEGAPAAYLAPPPTNMPHPGYAGSSYLLRPPANSRLPPAVPGRDSSPMSPGLSARSISNPFASQNALSSTMSGYGYGGASGGGAAGSGSVSPRSGESNEGSSAGGRAGGGAFPGALGACGSGVEQDGRGADPWAMGAGRGGGGDGWGGDGGGSIIQNGEYRNEGNSGENSSNSNGLHGSFDAVDGPHVIRPPTATDAASRAGNSSTIGLSAGVDDGRGVGLDGGPSGNGSKKGEGFEAGGESEMVNGDEAGVGGWAVPEEDNYFDGGV